MRHKDSFPQIFRPSDLFKARLQVLCTPGGPQLREAVDIHAALVLLGILQQAIRPAVRKATE